MNVGSLFSGIGGFDLGLERAGFTTSWFCEQDDYCRRILNRHWPGAPVYPDVTRLRGADVEPVDVLCGGFPCQDLSLAGKGAGIDGARSGLWSEFARLIGELRPRYVLVENVPALLGRGAGRVLGDLSALGYDTEWDCLPASAFGAPHRRDRFWLVAYPCSQGRRENPGGAYGDEASDAGRGEKNDHVAVGAGQERVSTGGRGAGLMADPDRERQPQPEGVLTHERRRVGDSSPEMARPDGERRERAGETRHRGAGLANGRSRARGSAPNSDDTGRSEQRRYLTGRSEQPTPELGGRWPVEPAVGRVADGFPGRVDQLRALGNALVPQIAEWIGRRVMAYESEVSA